MRDLGCECRILRCLLSPLLVVPLKSWLNVLPFVRGPRPLAVTSVLSRLLEIRGLTDVILTFDTEILLRTVHEICL